MNSIKHMIISLKTRQLLHHNKKINEMKEEIVRIYHKKKEEKKTHTMNECHPKQMCH